MNELCDGFEIALERGYAKVIDHDYLIPIKCPQCKSKNIIVEDWDDDLFYRCKNCRELLAFGTYYGNLYEGYENENILPWIGLSEKDFNKVCKNFSVKVDSLFDRLENMDKEKWMQEMEWLLISTLEDVFCWDSSDDIRKVLKYHTLHKYVWYKDSLKENIIDGIRNAANKDGHSLTPYLAKKLIRKVFYDDRDYYFKCVFNMKELED